MPLVYAIGDIHGRYDLLKSLWAQIEDDVKRRSAGAEEVKVVFLGDYIDRGPDSREVLEFLADLKASPPAWCEPLFLIGNHELIMLHFLGTEDDEVFRMWRDVGDHGESRGRTG
jgi:serine/threonine protein phosphatase 1